MFNSFGTILSVGTSIVDVARAKRRDRAFAARSNDVHVALNAGAVSTCHSAIRSNVTVIHRCVRDVTGSSGDHTLIGTILHLLSHSRGKALGTDHMLRLHGVTSRANSRAFVRNMEVVRRDCRPARAGRCVHTRCGSSGN